MKQNVFSCNSQAPLVPLYCLLMFEKALGQYSHAVRAYSSLVCFFLMRGQSEGTNNKTHSGCLGPVILFILVMMSTIKGLHIRNYSISP